MLLARTVQTVSRKPESQAVHTIWYGITLFLYRPLERMNDLEVLSPKRLQAVSPGRAHD